MKPELRDAVYTEVLDFLGGDETEANLATDKIMAVIERHYTESDEAACATAGCILTTPHSLEYCAVPQTESSFDVSVLRAMASWTDGSKNKEWLNGAADEIERLRAEVKAYQAAITKVEDAIRGF